MHGQDPKTSAKAESLEIVTVVADPTFQILGAEGNAYEQVWALCGHAVGLATAFRPSGIQGLGYRVNVATWIEHPNCHAYSSYLKNIY